MRKRILTLSTIACYLLFCWACTIMKTTTISRDYIVEEKGGIFIAAVETNKDETIEFDAEIPSRIAEGLVTGYAKPGQFEIPESEIEKTIPHSSDRTIMILKDGREIRALKTIRREGPKMMFLGQVLMKIPIADVRSIRIKEKDASASARATVATIVVVLVAAGVLFVSKFSLFSGGFFSWH